MFIFTCGVTDLSVRTGKAVKAANRQSLSCGFSGSGGTRLTTHWPRRLKVYSVRFSVFHCNAQYRIMLMNICHVILIESTALNMAFVVFWRVSFMIYFWDMSNHRTWCIEHGNNLRISLISCSYEISLSAKPWNIYSMCVTLLSKFETVYLSIAFIWEDITYSMSEFIFFLGHNRRLNYFFRFEVPEDFVLFQT